MATRYIVVCPFCNEQFEMRRSIFSYLWRPRELSARHLCRDSNGTHHYLTVTMEEP